VFVTTVVTGAVLDMKLKEDTTEMEFHTYRGVVRPHPRLQVVLDERQSVVTSDADLAVILLDEPVSGRILPARLAHAEAQVGESLFMAGYAHDARIGSGGVYGVRYFRKNPVTRAAGNGRVLYRQQGPSLWDGYFGGPCFREDSAGQWLVGIASRSSGEELACTSTSFFRDWLEAELRNAATRGSPSIRTESKE
jgi:hypothetical protein